MLVLNISIALETQYKWFTWFILPNFLIYHEVLGPSIDVYVVEGGQKLIISPMYILAKYPFWTGCGVY